MTLVDVMAYYDDGTRIHLGRYDASAGYAIEERIAIVLERPHPELVRVTVGDGEIWARDRLQLTHRRADTHRHDDPNDNGHDA